MAKTDRWKQRKSGRKGPHRSSITARILREWRGCDEPLDLKKGLHHPSEFLEEILESAGVESGIKEEKLRTTWAQVAGEFIASHTEPVSIRNGELLLRVSQPALRFQLERMKPDLLHRVRQALGDSIRNIRFSHG